MTVQGNWLQLVCTGLTAIHLLTSVFALAMEHSPKDIDIDALLNEASVYARVEHLRAGVNPSAHATARLLSIANKLQCILYQRQLLFHRAPHVTIDGTPTWRIERTMRIEHALRMCRAVVAPVRRLPRELLIMIFELALPWKWEEAYATQILHFASVCHYWREVVTGYGRFWSTIRMHQTTHAGAVENRIRWSSNSSLEVSLIHLDPHSRDGAQWNAAALHVLFSQSHRMRRLSLALDTFYPDVIQAIGHFWPRAMPQLEELELKVFDNLAEAVRDFANLAPNLVVLQLVCEKVPAPIEFPPTWKLTSLKLHMVEQGQYLHEVIANIAACAPTLESLDVYVLDVGEIDAQFATIVFPNLQTLTLRFDACYLCRYAVAPRIVNLKLEREDPGMSGQDESEIRSVDSTGFCPVESLELIGMTPAHPQLLEHLAIQDSDLCLDLIGEGDEEKLIISPELLRAMTRSSGSDDAPQNKMLPKLSTLGVLLQYEDEEVEKLLDDMIASRVAVSNSDDLRPLASYMFFPYYYYCSTKW
ncbi:hypothetical protein EV714DRAFT_284277 [Schizophyllum commune]